MHIDYSKSIKKRRVFATSLTVFLATVIGVVSGSVIGAQPASATSNASTVTAISPATGPSSGLTAVTITGSGFNQATMVTFGSASITTTPCSSSPTAPCFTINSDTQITAYSPPQAAGTVHITVTSKFGVTSSFTDSNGNIVSPTSITGGPDNALWFTNSSATSIGRIAPDGTISSFSDASISSPAQIVAGPDNALWFTNSGNNSIGRITPAGVVTNFTDPTINAPHGIVVGPDNALWFTNAGNPGSIGRITTDGVVNNYTDLSVNIPFDITSGPDGALWVTSTLANSIIRVVPGADAATTPTFTKYTSSKINSPLAITTGIAGELWFTNAGSPGNPSSIGEIVPAADTTSAPTIQQFSDPSINQPQDISSGADGAMWFTNQGNNSIGRITTDGVITNFNTADTPAPVAIAAGPDGSMWFTRSDNAIGNITTKGQSSLATSADQFTYSGVGPAVIGFSSLKGSFYPNTFTSSQWNPNSLGAPVWTQNFNTINFNNVTNQNCGNGINGRSRPFTNVYFDRNGQNCSVTPAVNPNNSAQAAGCAGTNCYPGNSHVDSPSYCPSPASAANLTCFQLSLQGQLEVSRAGTVTWQIAHDDGFQLGIGGGATPGPGNIESGWPTSCNNSFLLGGLNQIAANQSTQASINQTGTDTITINFPAAGSYPIELDYTESVASVLTLSVRDITDGGLIPGPNVGTTIPKGTSLGHYDAAVLNDGPSAYYRLGETCGSKAYDYSGNGNDGTYDPGVVLNQTGALVNDANAAVNSGTVSSTSAMVNTPVNNLPLGNSNRTMEMWFKTTSTASMTLASYGHAGAQEPYGGQGEYFGLGIVNGNAIRSTVFHENTGRAYTDFKSPYYLADNQWHYVSVVYDDSTHVRTVYVDGQYLGGSFAELNTGSTQPLMIGNGQDGTHFGPGWGGYYTEGDANFLSPFTGSIDEFAIYPTALTEAQINNHWKASQNVTCADNSNLTGYPSVIMSDNPSRFLRLGDTAALTGNAILDQSANCVVGTYNSSSQRNLNPSPVIGDSTGAVGSAPTQGVMGLSGTSALPYGNNPRTMETWFKTTSTDSMTLASYGHAGAQEPYWDQGQYFGIGVINGNAIRLTTYHNGQAHIDVSTPYSISDNRWHYVGVTYSASYATIYLDGHSIGTVFTNELQTGSGQALWLGSGQDGTHFGPGWGGYYTEGDANFLSPFSGQLSNFAIFNTSLSADRIYAHYLASGIPVITQLSSRSGTTLGGDSLTVTGYNLNNVASLVFGGTSSTYTTNSATQITATTPAHTAGIAPIAGVTPGGVSGPNSEAAQFYYINPVSSNATPSNIWSWGYNSSGQLGNGTNLQQLSAGQRTSGNNFISISAGSSHTLALDKNGNIWAWGDNTYGQLGDGTTTNRYTPVQITHGGGFAKITAGYNHSMALDGNGNIWTWGYNQWGQLGDGTTTNNPTPTLLNTSVTFTAIGTESGSSLAVDQNGNIWAWGYNGNGELGDTTNTQRNTPVQVTTSGNFVSVTGGTNHAIALDKDGNIWGWGYNDYGQLGDGGNSRQYAPQQVTTSGGFVAVAAGYYHSLALDNAGHVWATGSDDQAQLGNAGAGRLYSFTQITTNNFYTAITANGYYSMALDNSGNSWAWGDNPNGQLGDGTTNRQYVPEQTSSGGNILALSAGSNHAISLIATPPAAPVVTSIPPATGPESGGTTVVINGDHLIGTTQVNFGTTAAPNFTVRSDKQILAVAPPGTGVVDVSVVNPVGSSPTVPADQYTYKASSTNSIITANLWAWGYNTNGDLGNGNNLQQSKPGQITIGNQFIQVSAGDNHSLGLDANGNIWSWGYGGYGQIGNGTTADQTTPLQITTNGGWKSVGVGGNSSYAIDANGHLWTWGYNQNGELGDGTQSTHLTPEQINTTAVFTQVVGGSNHAAALDTNGDIWTWGYNDYGSLGDGSTNRRYAPVQVTHGGGFTKVFAGAYNTLALDYNGNVWGWGDNDQGQLGDGTNQRRYVPAQLTTAGGYLDVAAGYQHTLIIDANGNVFATGSSDQGQIGDGTGNRRYSFLQITTSGNFKAVAAHSYQSMALDSNGNVWTWGDNSNGEVGNSSANNVYAPVQVTTAGGYISIASGGNFSTALKPSSTQVPVISSLAPNSGNVNGGNQIVINGTGLLGSTQVLFGSNPATTFSVRSDTQILATAPAGTGTVDVSVTNPAGTSTTVTADQYTYNSVTPATPGVSVPANLWSWGYSATGQLGSGNNLQQNNPGQRTIGNQFVKIATGDNHTLALDANGNVWAWGSNSNGQIGNGTTIAANSPIQLTTSGGYKSVAAGGSSSAAIDANGNIWTWGYNNNGELGNGNQSEQHSPGQITTSGGFVSVASGSNHSVALDANGNVWAWGYNDYGSLGDGSQSRRYSPVQITQGGGFVSIAAGAYNSFAIDFNGNVWGWGDNDQGQLGDGTNQRRYVPTQLTTAGGYLDVAAGYQHTLIVDAAGNVFATGSSDQGQIGDGTGNRRYSFLQITTSGNFTNVAARGYHSMALDKDGNVWTWGENSYGQEGNGGVGNVYSPVKVTQSGGYTAISAGWNHSAALKPSATQTPAISSLSPATGTPNGGNSVVITGTNFVGSTQVLFGSNPATTFNVRSDTQIFATAPAGTGTVDVSITNPAGTSATVTADQYTYAVPTTPPAALTGNLWGWGYNANNELGNGNTAEVHAPLQSATANFVTIAAGVDHALALDANGNVWAWGYNAYGQVGDGSTSNHPNPVQITSTGGFVSIAAGGYHSLAVDGNGNIWVWGYNNNGELGTGNQNQQNLPYQLTTNGNFKSVSAGYNHSVALDKNGNVWAWGYNDYGQVGNESSQRQYSPVQVTQGGGFTQISAGAYFTMALDLNGNIWTWGSNDQGQIGDGTNSRRYAPVQSTFTGGFVSISASGYSGHALDSNGNIWSVGSNDQGQIGDGTGNRHYTYVQVTTSGNFKQIVAGGGHTAALDKNGNIWAWGDNPNGQLGNGTTNRSYSPIQITQSGGFLQLGAMWNGTLALAPAIAPSITAIHPNSGVPAGGNTVVINGNHLSGTTQVKFGNAAAVSFNVTSDNTILATAPAGTGTVDITVTNPVGTSPVTNADKYTYAAPAVLPTANIWGTGDNSSSQFGDGSTNSTTTFVQATATSKFTVISAGVNHGLALDASGNVWSWGSNSQGQLGDNTNTNHATPEQVTSGTRFVAVAASGDHSMALDSNGNIWSWGYNNEGELGDGTNNTRSAPEQISVPGTKFISIAAGQYHSLAIDSNYNVWAWGYNGAGEIGNGNTNNQYSPAQVTSSNNIQSIAAGTYHSLAIDFNGNIWAWGEGDYGQLGTGNGNRVYSPIQVTNSGNYVAIAGGGWHTIALDANGNLWAAGDNPEGRLGDGTTNRQYSLVQTTNSGIFKSISANGRNGAALDRNGNIWTWGDNGNGQIGNGTNNAQLSPLQVTTIGGYTQVASEWTATLGLHPPAAAQVTSINPATGPSTGGTSVVITGTNFTGATAVKFGGAPAASFTVDSNNQITAVSPANTGTVDITVTTAGGVSASSSADMYAYTSSITGCNGNFSANQACATVNITPGSLVRLNAPNINYAAVNLTGQAQSTTANVAYQIQDATGSGNGWSVSLSATTFTDTANNHTLPDNSLTLNQPTSQNCLNPECTVAVNTVGGPIGVITATNGGPIVKILDAAANTGMGSVETDTSTSLEIPANAYQGSYTSTWTISLSSGP